MQRLQKVKEKESKSKRCFNEQILTCDFFLVRLRLCAFVQSDTDPERFWCAPHVFTLPRRTGIIKSFLSYFPLLSAYSSRHSSSAPVCSCYAHCSLFFSPQYFLAVHSLLIPRLFMCHRQRSGVCVEVITNSKQTACLYFPH